jgi:ribosomal protein RSM22 (predicted rRNA methylase)
MKHWKSEELATLRKLRERFLTGRAGEADYWRSEGDLALYDATFAERIGWKWDAVLRELAARGWQPRSRTVLDWGCGSGVAGRRVLARWPQIESLALHDRSPLAVWFAMEKARALYPGVRVSKAEAHLASETLLVLSHVINELPSSVYARVLDLVRQVNEVIWVEAGTHADSRRLIEVRETLRAEFTPVAPCTHRASCGLLAPKNAVHWCHYFAAPPSSVFQDARWAEWGREMGIDLRSLPYSFLVLERNAPSGPASFSRVIGEPRERNGYLKVLSCQEEGVEEFMLQKRDSPSLYREIRKGEGMPIYRWSLKAGKIVGGERTSESGASPVSDGV